MPENANGNTRAPSSSGANDTMATSSALSRTGISRIRPRTRSGAIAATSSATLAPSDVPPMTAWLAPSSSSSATTCRANDVTE